MGTLPPAAPDAGGAAGGDPGAETGRPGPGEAHLRAGAQAGPVHQRHGLAAPAPRPARTGPSPADGIKTQARAGRPSRVLSRGCGGACPRPPRYRSPPRPPARHGCALRWTAMEPCALGAPEGSPPPAGCGVQDGSLGQGPGACRERPQLAPWGRGAVLCCAVLRVLGSSPRGQAAWGQLGPGDRSGSEDTGPHGQSQRRRDPAGVRGVYGGRAWAHGPGQPWAWGCPRGTCDLRASQGHLAVRGGGARRQGAEPHWGCSELRERSRPHPSTLSAAPRPPLINS